MRFRGYFARRGGKTMKKRYAFIAVLFAFAFLLTACNDSEEKVDDGNKPIENGEVNPGDHPENGDDTTEEDVDDNKDNEEQQPLTLEEVSEQVVEAIHNKDLKPVAEYVHPEKGLLFSPYVHVENNAVVIEKDGLENLLASDRVYTWGIQDGRGTPIDLTPNEYFVEFLDMTPFLEPDDILIDDPQDRGNTMNNVAEKFPDAHIVEYYNDGSDEFEGMDWASVLFVFEEDEAGNPQLIAIVRDMWTI